MTCLSAFKGGEQEEEESGGGGAERGNSTCLPSAGTEEEVLHSGTNIFRTCSKQVHFSEAEMTTSTPSPQSCCTFSVTNFIVNVFVSEALQVHVQVGSLDVRILTGINVCVCGCVGL